MSNKLLNFDSFVKGSKLGEPKTALDVKAAAPVKKEKSIDQVKRASLSTGIKSTEPDYTKTKSAPIQEAATDTQAEIDAINATRELRKELATADTDDKRLSILNRIKQVQTQIEQKNKASKPI
jgi:hypothetical protein